MAKALICQSLRVLRDRGMHEAALGVHTENPTGAFQLYLSLGYEVVSDLVDLRAAARLVEIGSVEKAAEQGPVAVHASCSGPNRR